MAEHDEVDAAALHDTLESVQKQLKLFPGNLPQQHTIAHHSVHQLRK